MRAVAAPFRSEDDDATAGVVSLVVGIEQPGFPARTREVLDLLVRVFTPDGGDMGTDHQLARVSVPAAPDEGARSRYEARTRISVPKPGRYELRASVHSAETDARGSIYVTVDVPDFRREKLSLSGVIVNALPRLPAPPEGPATDVTALGPTTERAFARDAVVTALLKAYQGGTRRLASISLSAVILDEGGKQVFERAETLAASQFAADRSAEYRLMLPMSTLAPGEYLLTITARLDETSVQRDVKFLVRTP
jgi:hypothetical protein